MTRFLTLTTALICAPLVALAVPVNVAGSYAFEGNGTVEAFTLVFDTVVDVEQGTEFVDLPLTSGSVTIGASTFSDPIHLRFATNAFGGFGALVLSQDSSPFASAALPDFFQISANFAPSVDINAIMSETVTAPLLGLDYIVAGTSPVFAFGQNFGLGTITFSTPAPVPLPASGVMLLSALGLLARRRNVAG